MLLLSLGPFRWSVPSPERSGMAREGDHQEVIQLLLAAGAVQ